MENMENTSLLCLPEEIILYIASYLTTADIFHAIIEANYKTFLCVFEKNCLVAKEGKT